MTTKIVPFVLAGGSGSRLWPMSRSLHPKQFWSLLGDNSLLQDTLKRGAGATSAQIELLGPLVVCNSDHRFLVREQCQAMDIDPLAILLEPAPRNTAPAIALAALALQAQGLGDAQMLVLPSDHIIDASRSYWNAIETAAKVAARGHLCTFGIQATHPATGFGYIEQGEQIIEGGYKVQRFVEKPDLRRAQQMLDGGGYSWNAGLFLFPVDLAVEELTRLAPDMMAHVARALEHSANVDGFHFVNKEHFVQAEDISIDYCLMENTDRGAVVPSAFSWSDVGAWDAVWAVSPKDALGNATSGPTHLSGVSNSLIRSSGLTIAATGVKDLVIVGTNDAVLVAHKDHAQDVKKLVSMVKSSANKDLTRAHDRMLYPWGETRLLDSTGPGTTAGAGTNDATINTRVKRVTMRADSRQSLHSHQYRQEIVTVIDGTLMIEITAIGDSKDADSRHTLGLGESITLEPGVSHRLVNPSLEQSVQFIEVQRSTQAGLSPDEDDIYRQQDDYGRTLPLKPEQPEQPASVE